MQQITLPNTDLKVSPLCLGTMYFGTKTDQSQSEELLDFFENNGGNFIDTSNNYAFWMDGCIGDESEVVLGKWFNNRGNRNKIIVATKCGARPRKFTGNLDNIELEGLSYETIIDAVEGSLKRLKTDYIDVLYSHIDFQEYPIEERLKAFTLLKEQGKVRCFGTSNTQAWRIIESQNLSKEKTYESYSLIQQKYSYLRPKHNADFWVQKLLNEEMLDFVQQRNDLTITVYSTLLSGAYTKSESKLPDEYDTPDNAQRMSNLRQMADDKGVTPNQLVLAWIMHHSPKLIPLITGSKLFQLEESMKTQNIVLSEEEFSRLNSSGD